MSRKPVEKKQISQEWLTTYSDMMTLVLTFFVLLYSYALVDNKKFNAMATSMNSAFGGSTGIFELFMKKGDAPIAGEKTPTQNAEDQKYDITTIDGMYKAVNDFINKNSMGTSVKVIEDTRGVIMEFNDSILFDTGNADLKSDSIPILMKVAELLNHIPNNIIIEGHTDNVPIHTAEFPSNWELSSKRAMTVMKYLTENRQIKANRFTVTACGEYKPIASNDTPEGRARNRRVNILIVTSDKKQ